MTCGSSRDRITSGKASVIANTSSGHISLTTGATTWGYHGSSVTFLPTGVLGNISASGVIKAGASSLTCSSAVSGSMRYSTTSSTMEYCNRSAWPSMGPSSTQSSPFRGYLPSDFAIAANLSYLCNSMSSKWSISLCCGLRWSVALISLRKFW